MTASDVQAGTRAPCGDDPGPCKCHQDFAAIAPTHRGHCCFVPATQTCHPESVAEWERRRDSQR